MKTTKFIAAVAVLGLLAAPGGHADTTEARCDIYPRGADHTDVVIPCRFYQAQGHVVITRSDGIEYDLMPVEDANTGTYVDQDGNRAYRQSGLGDQGLIFRMADESVYVYWSTAGLPGNEPDPDNPTAPYTTADYDATTLLPCGIGGTTESCPAGILRMEDGQASIVIMSPRDEEFTINFMKDYTNATGGREVEAEWDEGRYEWHVVVNGDEHYLVPLAAIEGG